MHFDQSQNGYYAWSIESKPAMLAMLAYFKQCPSRSAKANRLRLVPLFYELQALNAYEQQSALRSA
jgi:hypothetical protein